MRLCLLIACLASVGTAQVRITLPKNHYRVQEEIPAKIENHGRHGVVFCVEIGRVSQVGNEIKSTPTPFVIERESANEWGVLMKGPDVGGSRQPLQLEAGKSVEFPFRLTDAGTLRLRLDYWKASSQSLDCTRSAKGSRKAWSKAFLQD